MKLTRIGEFQELILLVVIILQNDAYGASIKGELEDRLKTNISVGSIQSSLQRLEEKEYLTSKVGEATPIRGGRRKKLYKITPTGRQVLVQMKSIRENLYGSISYLRLKLD
ncbi:MAG: helix-turn-helix transcriptional regulator [Bacteroidota bacterium]